MFVDLYRHVGYAPLILFSEFGELSKINLSGDSTLWGDRIEQFASRPEIFANKPVMEVINLVFSELM